MRQLMRQSSAFLVVGAIATLVHYLIIVVLVDLLSIMRPTPATAVGSVVGIAVAYVGNQRLVFQADGAHRIYVPKFVATYLSVMAIHAGLMYLFTEQWGLAYEWGFITATIVSATTTFFANRLVVFKVSGLY